MENLENKYYELIGNKAYFDAFCHEFKNKETEDKLLNLALYLNEGRNLHFVVDSYKTNKSENTLSSLIDTILFYIDYLRTGEVETMLSVLLKKYFSEYQIITLLEAELKSRLTFEFEHNDDFSVMKKKYKIEIGGYDIEKYLDQNKMGKKEQLISIFKGNLTDNFDFGDFEIMNTQYFA